MQRIVIIVIVLFVVLAFMTTYTVRFTEAAVVTTFGKADEKSVSREPGLRLKVPYVQKVTRYDTRARYLELKAEQFQTADNKTVVVTAYMAWRVSDPLVFFTQHSGFGPREADHYRRAEEVLRSTLRGALGEISQYRLDELLASNLGSSKLPALEKTILENVSKKGEADGGGKAAGVEPLSVGLVSIVFPKDNTTMVFNRMKAGRERLATRASMEGVSRGDTIKSSAEADAKRIMAFAERLAQDIRKQGDIEAADYLKQMDEDSELAVFLRNMDFLKQAFGAQTTLVLPASMPGFEFLRLDAIERMKASIPAATPEKASPTPAGAGTKAPAKPGTGGAP